MYYVGTQQFNSLTEATNYVRANGGTITTSPSAPSDSTSGGGLLTGGINPDTSTPTGDSTSGDGTGSVKGDPIKQAPLVSDSPSTPQTFTLIEGREKGDRDFQNYLYGQEGEPRQVTVDELRTYFESDDVNRLREMFGTFDNYLAYMTEREQLLQSGDLTTGDWANADAGFTEDQQMILEGDADLTIDPSDPGQNLENLLSQQRGAQAGAYQNWLNSEANQALLQKYGVQSTVYSGSGDKFQWNGSAYVKVEEASNPGVTDFVKSGILAAMTFYAGGPLAEALGPVFGGNTALAAGASSGITNAAMQLLATGEVDLEQALESAISAGLSTSAINYLQESGALDALTESLNELTQDTVRLADGTELPLNQVSTGVYEVTLPSGSTLGYEAFAQVAESLMGSPVVAEVTRSLPDWINDVTDAFAASGTAQGVVDLLQSTQGGSSAAGATVSGDLNFQPSDVTVLDQIREAIEREENPETRTALEEELRRLEEEQPAEEEVVDPNASTIDAADSGIEDTTVDAPGITEEMFQDVIDQVRADNQVETQEIIDAINALGVADLPTLAQIESAFPELNDVSLQEIGDTVSTLLSNAGLLTSEQFTEAMAGVLTPEQLDTALANLPYGDAQDFIDAISNAGYATPEDVATALNNADLMSNEDFSTYMEQFRQDVVGDVDTLIDEAFAGFTFPETFTEEQIQQLRDSIVIPESATMEQIQTALDALAEQIPAAAPTLEEMQTLFNTELANLDIASPEDVRTILSEYGFTEAQLEQIAGSITIPESATVAEVQAIVDAIPAGLTAEEVATQLSSQFEGLTEDIAGVQGGIDQLAEDLGLSTEGLLTAIENLGTTSGENLTELQTNILEGLGLLSRDLGVDIGDVVTSVTDLETGVAEGIEGLGEQLTGLGEGITGVETAVTGVTTAVNQGVEDLAEALGVQTDDITSAIVTLGSGLGGELTELETSVLTGLTNLATSLGTDVGTVVDSIGGLGTGISENIQGLSDTLTEQLGTGFGGISGQLESGFGQLGQQLGLATLGLFGLGAKQPTAQQIAAAKPFEFKPFEEKATPRQVQQVVQAAPIKQQPSALQQINKFISSQTTTPQQPPRKPGMLV